MEQKQTVLITGANRGIGLELTRQLVIRGNQIFATCRNPNAADKLNALAGSHPGQITVIQMDVTQDGEVSAAASSVQAQTTHIDLIINNAGVNPQRGFAQFDAADFLKTLDINAVGAMRVASAFVDLLRKGSNPKLVNISSQLGSLEAQRPNFGSVDYNTSKAAMNMITKHLSFDLAPDGITVISMHPGWVQTDMGGANAAVTIPDSAAGILNVIYNLSMTDNGEFFIYNGQKHPW